MRVEGDQRPLCNSIMSPFCGAGLLCDQASFGRGQLVLSTGRIASEKLKRKRSVHDSLGELTHSALCS